MTLNLPITAICKVLNRDDFIDKDCIETSSHTLLGEVSVIRYLSKSNPSIYGDNDVIYQCENDLWLDWYINSAITLPTINEALNDRIFLSGYQLGLADILAWSFIIQNNPSNVDEFPNIKRWLRTLDYNQGLKDAKKIENEKSKAKNSKRTGSKKMGGCPDLEGNPDPKDVVTRFPPEPSGHLHIGHCKALFLNQYYARDYNGGRGKLLLRFDDTNPAAEKEEYEEAILQDLRALNVIPDQISHTSDHFDLIEKKARELISKGLAYCDYSTQKELEIQRGGKTGIRLPSPCRDQTVEFNLQLFELMKKGQPYKLNDEKDGLRMCSLRAKITDEKGRPGYDCGNGSMRDPVLYRVVLDPPHAKCGRKYKMYPTYDFACPIVDSIEGVTHVLRDSQYSDRTEQFQWIQNALGLRKCYIQQFSRVNFKRTLMSKRKLAELISPLGVADGWDDPRFPTVKGMLRRGLLTESVRDFMLGLGGSLKQVDMEWDKIWSDNMRRLDPIANRYMAVDVDTSAKVEIVNFFEYHGLDATKDQDTIVSVSIPLHPKDASKGMKTVIVSKTLLIEKVDLEGLEPGHTLGLQRYAVTKVENVDVTNGIVQVSIIPDGDFRACQKLITWVSASELEPRIKAWEYDFLLKEDDSEDDDGGNDWRKNLNEHSKASATLVTNSGVKLLQKGDFVQFERRGFFILDKPYSNDQTPMEFIQIPDGKKNAMSIIKGKLEHR